MKNLLITSPTFLKIKDYVVNNHGFTPVNVQHGRKFKGFGYVTEVRYKSNGGFHGSGVRPYAEYDVNYVYVPDEDAFGEFNNYNEKTDKVEVPEKQLTQDFYLYLTSLLISAEQKCGTDRNYFKNYVRKVLDAKAMPMSVFDDLVSELFD